MWRQRSRVAWIKEGGQNTQYFLKMANNRKRHNQIKALKMVTLEVRDQRAMQNLIDSHFKEILGKTGTHEIKFKDKILENSHSLRDLNEVIMEEETKQAIKGLAKEKAPGPDGFPILFYTRF